MDTDNFRQPLFSIIIPVYNTEKYLRHCLDSVLAQTFKDFEVILVDDGSTDGTGQICDEYAEKNLRIRVLHKSNSGVSDSRNKGLNIAKGKWIFFLDSDDEIHPYCLSMMKFWSKDCDMVVGKFEVFDYRTGYESIPEPEKLCIRDETFKKFTNKCNFVRCLLDNRKGIPRMVFPKLFKSEVINKFHLRFNKNIYYAEDQLFLAQYLCCPKVRVIHLNDKIPVYKYNIWNGNATSKMNLAFNNKLFTDFLAFNQIYNIYNIVFHDRVIDEYSMQDAYNSGRHLLELITKTGNAFITQKTYIEKMLAKLSSVGRKYHLQKKYEGKHNFLIMKQKAIQMSTEQRIDFIQGWLHSSNCYYTELNVRWKILYLLSYLFGKNGVRLVINKINFNA